MEHLVESHLGGYYISNSDPEIIEAYCDQCGDSDRIILSWKEGQRLESLTNYFSKVKNTSEQLEECKEHGITTEELIFSLTYDYDNDRYLINELAIDNIITHEEEIFLLKQVSITQKKQFEDLKRIYYPNGLVRKRKEQL